MNWYKLHCLADKFYDLLIHDNYKFAMAPSSRMKQVDLKRWGQLHGMLADAIGLDSSAPEYIDKFIELSDVFRELTDRLGHLPSKIEFLTAWHSWQMYKELKNPDVPGYQYGGIEVGKVKEESVELPGVPD